MSLQSKQQGGALAVTEGSNLLSGTPYFPQLDGLRALSVFAVCGNHIYSTAPPAIASYVHGWVGVQIFFVLSGFLITSLLMREEQQTQTISLQSFYLRRAFRILPMYLATLVLYFIVCLSPFGRDKLWQFIQGLPYFLTFLNEYTPESVGTVFGQGWSLGIEEKFYLVWPLFFFCLAKSWRARAYLLLSGLLLSASLPYYYAHCYFAIGVGCLIAFAYRLPQFSEIVRRLPAVVAAAAVAGSYYLLHLDANNRRIFVIAVGVLMATLISQENFLRRIFSASPLVWVGKRSYSIYLLHILAMNAVRPFAPREGGWGYFINWFAGFALSVVLSHFAYVWIERPMIAKGREYIQRRFGPMRSESKLSHAEAKAGSMS
jgi:peptidoglycan/LPS O-acetylase OafA/YrhL